MLEYENGDIITLKKGHACGENKWEIIRKGADIKIKCLECERELWLTRMDFEKKVRKIKENNKFISIIHHHKNK